MYVCMYVCMYACMYADYTYKRQRRTVTKWTANIQADCHYTERGALTREGLSNHVKSVLIQVLTWLRRSVGLTALPATLS